MRVELAKLILSKYDLILLDEPTNHLDIEAILWFERFLQQYTGSFMLVSHDVSFLNNTIKKVYEISNQRLSVYTGNYDKYVIDKAERIAIQEESHPTELRKIELMELK